MTPKHRAPTPPGEILLEEFLVPLGLTQTALAQQMKVPLQRVNTLINGRSRGRRARLRRHRRERAVTAETALLLAKALGTSAEFWLSLQMQCDLYQARRQMATG